MRKIDDREIQCNVIRRMQYHVLEDNLRRFTAAAIISESNAKNPDAYVSISIRTIVNWFDHYCDLGEIPCDTLDKAEKKQHHTVLWNPATDAELKRIVDQCPVLYLDEIAARLKLFNGLKYSLGGISKRLRKTLKYSRKVVHEKATQAIAMDKLQFILTMRLLIERAEMAIFVDESNKDRKAAKRKYGWSPVGTDPNYRSLFNMDLRYTLIGAADCFGFVQSACDVVLHAYYEKEECPPVDTGT